MKFPSMSENVIHRQNNKSVQYKPVVGAWIAMCNIPTPRFPDDDDVDVAAVHMFEGGKELTLQCTVTTPVASEQVYPNDDEAHDVACSRESTSVGVSQSS